MAPDVDRFLDELGIVGVPFAYADQLRRIRLTVCENDGTYRPDVITLHAGPRLGFGWSFYSALLQNSVHELGHHVDALEAISEDPAVAKEYRRGWRHLPDRYARKDVGEYIAVGFEVFYCGTDEQLSTMKKRNPRLYRRIQEAHRKYRKC